MASRKLEVEITGDSTSLARAFGRAGKSGNSFGHALTGLAKTAGLVVGGAALGGLAIVLKQGAAEFSQHAKVAAQTNAVLKSTAGVAGVTAKHVDELANAILRKTGIDDEAVQASENLLLGFTNVRNELGKGNNIFDRATMLVQDYATRTGKSATQATIAFGKALNDPVKGMGALGRAGIILTDKQKALIKGWEDHGQHLKAQTYLLGQLETRFGGAAEAAGKTLPGQLNVLKESFNNLSADVISSLIPTLQKVVTWTTANWPEIEKVFKTVFEGIGVAVSAVITAIRFLIPFGEQVVAAVRSHWTQISATVMRAVADIRGVIEGFVIIGKAIWAQFGGALTAVTKTTFGTLVTVIRDVFRIIEGVFRLFSDLLHGNWSKAWADLKQIAKAALDAVAVVLRGAISILFTLAKAIGGAILEGIGAALKRLGVLVKDHWQAVIVFMLTLPSQLGSIAFSIGKSIVSGILSGLGDLASKVGGKIKDGVSGAVHFAGGLLHGSGEFMFTKQAIGEPLAKGVIEGWLEGTASLPSKISEKLSAAIERGRQLIDSKRGVFTTAFGRLTDRIFSAFDAATAQHQTPAEKLIAQITDRRQMEDLQKALEDALTGGDPQAILRAQEDIQMVSLQKQADDERQNYNARRDNLRQTLEDRLAMLQTHFTKEGSTVGELTKGITRLLASFGLDFANVGDLLGNAFVTGLKKAIATAGKGSSAIEKTIATVADNIRTTVPTGKAFAMASGGSGTVTKPTLFMAGEAGREDFAFSGGGKSFGSRGGGDVYVTINAPNYVGDKRDLISTVRQEFSKIQRNGGKLGFANG
jgi:phage-related protein